ncbi:MAG: hypothetical protein LH605_03815 [Microbacteriaceae bacterium]|nr:hypothetical protein [Microbacteriaceae bacterium]
MTNSIPRTWLAVFAVASLTGGLALASAPASAAPPTLTNLAHLDFLLDTAEPGEVDGHTTYNLASEPELTMPWTYADARAGGTFERVGGGPLDPATGYWGQGAYNSDDITRTAVVYIRDWQQTGSVESRKKAYQLLRSTAYFQTTTGENAGNVVLWMQPDGTFNPSPEPVELPDPSDSGESYWLARTLWALGEGYAAFQNDDPDFAAFLQDRLQLSVGALERQTLDKYGEYDIADGVKVPAWLIVDGADASAEAVLGLSAYSEAAPDDESARTALAQLAEGIAEMGAGDTRSWPYGAILPWAQSRSMWHAWASQMPAALAEASTVLDDDSLLKPAIADSVGFTTTLLTAGGPDNGWFPAPVDRVQIAYGADSRLQSLLAVGDAADRPGLRDLAGIMGAWYFGMNNAGEPVYDPETGVTYDGVQADGSINRNSGAESTIHGQLSMIALDANPDVAERAQAAADVSSIDGLTLIEAETSTATTGAVITPDSAWTGESLFGGGKYLELTRGEKASFALTPSVVARTIEPVAFQEERGSAKSQWKAGRHTIGVLTHSVGKQGITAVPGALLPQTLEKTVDGSGLEVSVTSLKGTVQLDSVIVRPVVSRLVVSGADASTELVHATDGNQKTTVGDAGQSATLRSYDRSGRLVYEREITGTVTIRLAAGGFATVTR